jgi:hypothetical protein
MPCLHHCCLSRPRDSAEKFASRQCLGWRVPQGPDGKSLGPYTFMTYKEAWDKAVQVWRAAAGWKQDLPARQCLQPMQLGPQEVLPMTSFSRYNHMACSGCKRTAW